jgi:hypothetical protein
MNSHSKQYPSNCFSDHTIQIHYTKSDHHVRWCSFNGEHQHVDHIIHMIRAQPFGFSCSEAMSVHARLVKATLVYSLCDKAMSVHARLVTPIVCTRRVYHTRSSRGVSKRRVLATVHTKEEHFIILIFSERDHLIMLPSRAKQNKIHERINITGML